MKKLLFVMPSLDSGGAEKSLVNLLNIIDYTHYNVDLLLLKQEGLFLNQIPKEVNILPVVDALHYAYKIDKYVFHSFASIKSGFLRIMSTFICKLFYKKNSRQQRWLKFYKRYLPNLENNYDVAIGFLEGDASYYVIDKVHAIKKILWIHNDFNEIKKNEDANVYETYFKKANAVATISKKCVDILKQNYPRLQDKFLCLPNLTSSDLIEKLSEQYQITEFKKNEFNILSIGRLTKQKGYDLAINALKILKDYDSNVHWWIIGAGELENQLKKLVKEAALEEYITFLGLKENPYPYIKKCDLLVQSSRWEGKSVVLDEAKILATPILATNYSTIQDQLIDQMEGLIVDMNPIDIAKGIDLLINDKSLYKIIESYLAQHNYGNEEEIKKYYNFFEN